MNKGVQFIRGCLLACGVLASQGQAAAQTIKSVAIDFQIITEIRPVAYQPGTLLFESGTFSLQNKYNTVTIHGLGVELPAGTSEVTWSVEFLNLGVGRAGLLLYDPPTLGDSHDDFWGKINGEWELKSTENGSNFAARLAGVPIGKEDDVVVYENAETSLGKVYLSSKEVADTVILDRDISELTAIQFEYYAALSPFGDIPKGKVRLYLNDGESQATAEVPVDPRGEIALQPGGLVVYDNARGAKGKIQFVSDEIGDEFTLDGSQRVINEIQFEYFAALNPFESIQKGVLRFYANNGPAVANGGAKKPGDLLFESDAFSLRAGYNMVTVSDLRVRVPEDVTSVTWAVEFTGVTNIGKVGLLQHDEPAKGASANTFWLNTGTKAAPNWQLQKPADGHGNFSARIAGQTPPPVSLAVGSEVYAMGEPVKVTFAEGPGNPKDWIGIYRPDMIPGSAAAPAWAYVNGYKTAGKGRTGGTLVFDDVLPAGNYVARFFENDDYDQLASATFSIAEPPGVAVGSEAYLPDEPITFHFARGPGNPKDWIAVYRPEMIPAKVPSLLWAFVNGTQTAGEGLASGSVTFASGLPAGEYVARYLENDDYNQLAEVSFNVTDITAPVITLKGQQSVTINVGETYEDAGATARDNVDGNITKSITITGVVDPSRPAVYTLIYTVKDNSGNAAAIVARTVRVLDAVAPVLTLKGEQSVTINAGENYKDVEASARDNVDGDISKSIKTTGTVNANKPGVYTIIYSVKDKSGNAAVSVVRTVTVVDAVSPVITLKGEQTVTINVGETYEDAGATARDNVDGNITKSITITGVVDPSRPAVYTLIYTVKDNSGNAAAIVARTVRVLDAVAPVLTLKGEQSVTINAGENYKDVEASARDNVDGDISKSIKTTGTVNANKPGVYTIIYSVKDKSGNAAVSVVRTVTVVDAVSPVITLKGEQSVTINAGENYTDAGATARDVVDGDISKLIGITGLIDTDTPGVYTITFNVKDSSGNTATAVVRTIEVVKLAPPMLTISRNRNSTITVTFEGQLQTADGVNAAWLTLDTESPAVLSTEKAAAFFRAVRN